LNLIKIATDEDVIDALVHAGAVSLLTIAISYTTTIIPTTIINLTTALGNNLYFFHQNTF
jgi:hypothetical protein